MLGHDARLALEGTRFTDVRELAEVASTNREVATLAGRGAPDGLVVVADHQTEGRGRRGRSWEAPPGSSLLVSALLRPPPDPTHLATMATGLAVVAACRSAAGVTASLKWPNDVMVEGSKLGGILAELVGNHGNRAVVVGLGLNVAWDVPLPPGGIDLRTAGGRTVERAALLVGFLRALETRCRRSAAEVVAEYRRRCSTIGEPVRAHLATEVVTGTATSVDDHGRLVVQTDHGSRTVTAGDIVHLR